MFTILYLSHCLFQVIQASVINTIHIINQSRKCTLMVVVTYNFDPEDLVEKLTVFNSLSPKQWSNHPLFCMTPIIFQNINNPSKVLFRFSSKNISVKNVVVKRILSIFGYFRICVISECYLVVGTCKETD